MYYLRQGKLEKNICQIHTKKGKEQKREKNSDESDMQKKEQIKKRGSLIEGIRYLNRDA